MKLITKGKTEKADTTGGSTILLRSPWWCSLSLLAVCKVKDDNIVQAMQKALLTSVDAWNEYQAARIKLHVDENALSTLRLHREPPAPSTRTLAAKQAADYEADIKKYQERSTRDAWPRPKAVREGI